jgi:hypothetical protein
MSVTRKKMHDSYVEKLADVFEKQGYKVVLEGGIPKYRKKEWGKPDIFVLKKEGSCLVLQKVVEVTLVDLKEGSAPSSLLSKCKKIKEYYNPPEIVVFEPTGYTSNYYSASLGGFTNYDEYNAYLHEKWKKEGLNVIFWNEWDLEEQKKRASSV